MDNNGYNKIYNRYNNNAYNINNKIDTIHYNDNNTLEQCITIWNNSKPC